MTQKLSADLVPYITVNDAVIWEVSESEQGMGKVIRELTEGTVDTEDQDIELEASPGNPVYVVQVYKNGKPTQQKEAFYEADLKRIEKKELEMPEASEPVSVNDLSTTITVDQFLYNRMELALNKEGKEQGADGKACWKGFKYQGTDKNGKDICVKASTNEDDEEEYAASRTAKGNVTAEERDKSAVLPDGRFPIFDKKSAESAIKLRGHAKSKADRMKIINRAAKFAPEAAKKAREAEKEKNSLTYNTGVTEKLVKEVRYAQGESSSGQSFKPTSGMVSAARQGLKWLEEKKAATPVGIARARDIVNGKSLSADTVKRMFSFFSRHEKSSKGGQGFSPGEKGYPSKGRIAWNLWGGDAGFSWSRKIVERLERQEKNSLYQSNHFEARPYSSPCRFEVGTFVAFTDKEAGEFLIGEVIGLHTKDKITIEGTDVEYTATPDNPVFIVRRWNVSDKPGLSFQPTEVLGAYQGIEMQPIGVPNMRVQQAMEDTAIVARALTDPDEYPEQFEPNPPTVEPSKNFVP